MKQTGTPLHDWSSKEQTDEFSVLSPHCVDRLNLPESSAANSALSPPAQIQQAHLQLPKASGKNSPPWWLIWDQDCLLWAASNSLNVAWEAELRSAGLSKPRLLNPLYTQIPGQKEKKQWRSETETSLSSLKGLQSFSFIWASGLLCLNRRSVDPWRCVRISQEVCRQPGNSCT